MKRFALLAAFLILSRGASILSAASTWSITWDQQVDDLSTVSSWSWKLYLNQADNPLPPPPFVTLIPATCTTTSNPITCTTGPIGLPPAGDYTFELTAIDDHGNESDFSVPVQIRCDSTHCYTYPAPAPINVRVP